MDKLPSMKDMRLTKEDNADYCMPCPSDAPAYPYGLCISLTQVELEKLGCTVADFEIGDLIHLQGMGVVTSVSEHKRQNADDTCRVEIQITHLSDENESDEYSDDETKESPVSKLYK